MPSFLVLPQQLPQHGLSLRFIGLCTGTSPSEWHLLQAPRKKARDLLGRLPVATDPPGLIPELTVTSRNVYVKGFSLVGHRLFHTI